MAYEALSFAHAPANVVPRRRVFDLSANQATGAQSSALDPTRKEIQSMNFTESPIIFCGSGFQFLWATLQTGKCIATCSVFSKLCRSPRTEEKRAFKY